MKEPPFWFQVIAYAFICLVAVWVGIRIAWWLGGMFI